MHTVYLITNLVNGKGYVGQTCRGSVKRWKQHTQDAPRLQYKSVRFYKALNKYGKESFDIQDLGYVNTPEEAHNLEMAWILVLNTTDPKLGYNSTPGGEIRSGIYNPSYGKKRSEEYCRKQSERMRGVNNYWYGKKKSEEFCNMMSKRMSGNNNPFYGKTHSKEILLRMSESKKGKYVGENSPSYGRKASPETRLKQRLAKLGKPGHWLGKKRDPETVKRIAEKHTRKDIPSGNDLITLYTSGLSCDDIAKKFNTCRSTISWRLRKLNAPLRSPGFSSLRIKGACL